MIAIGEKINATNPRVARAIEERDADHIARLARAQAEAGADFIDVNAASKPARETENLLWAVRVVQEATDRPLCLDSPSPDALRAALDAVECDEVMLNSVTAEREKMEAMLPLAAEAGARLVALTMDDTGLPRTAEQRVQMAAALVDAAGEAGVPPDRLYFDPCIQPLSTSPEQAMECLSAVFRIMGGIPGVHTTCGLSNISFGLPNRGLINRTYLGCLIMAGLDSAIVDPTAEGIMEIVLAGEALAGRDEFCMDYIRAMR